MQLAMRVLEASQLDLADLIQQEIETNPLLDIEPPTGDVLSSDQPSDPLGDPLAGQAGDPLGDPLADPAEGALDGLNEMALEPALPSDTSTQDEFDLDYIREEREWTALRDQGEERSPASERSAQLSATDVIIRDLFDLSLPIDLRDLAIVLVYWLDEAGYLRESDTELAAALNTDGEKIAQARACLQSLEPAGLAARSLTECFAIQLERKHLLTPLMQDILDHLDLLSQGTMAQMARALNVAPDQIKEHLGHLQRLSSRPLSELEFASDVVMAPDIRIFERAGQWVAEINEDHLPAVHLREDYWQELARLDKRSQLDRYLRQHRRSGRWLQRTIFTRAMSLLRVSNAIIARQADYFTHGPLSLKPMTIRQIAEDVGLNEGTVSRVVANKIIETPLGVMPLKTLFTSAVGSDDVGDAFASGAIKHRIKALIDAEPSAKPYSDSQLQTMLKKEGIVVARRTVTKYREALALGSSVERRRHKQLVS